MSSSNFEKEYEEIRKKEAEEIKKREKAEKKQGLSLLYLLLACIIFFGTIFAGEGMSILGGIVFLAILIYTLHQFNVL